jgi:DNA-directed RNA polymerase subunit RPC12/RpoP
MENEILKDQKAFAYAKENNFFTKPNCDLIVIKSFDKEIEYITTKTLIGCPDCNANQSIEINIPSDIRGSKDIVCKCGSQTELFYRSIKKEELIEFYLMSSPSLTKSNSIPKIINFKTGTEENRMDGSDMKNEITKSQINKICDLCNESISESEMVIIPISEMKQAVQKGWSPPINDALSTVANIMGLDNSTLGNAFYNQVMNDSSDWGVCSSCYDNFRNENKPTQPPTSKSEINKPIETNTSKKQISFIALRIICLSSSLLFIPLALIGKQTGQGALWIIQIPIVIIFTLILATKLHRRGGDWFLFSLFLPYIAGIAIALSKIKISYNYSFVCLGCGQFVPDYSKISHECPHCGLKWENGNLFQSHQRKKCTGCGRLVSDSSQKGQNCPHCGAYWSDDNTVNDKFDIPVTGKTKTQNDLNFQFVSNKTQYSENKYNSYPVSLDEKTKVSLRAMQKTEAITFCKEKYNLSLKDARKLVNDFLSENINKT